MTSLPHLLARTYHRIPQGVHLGLERVLVATEQLGHPERSWPSLHIAGTNGKGSVAATTSLALARAGYRVGLFTSPHLQRFAERIRINQEPIGDSLLASALEQALKFDLTFFELTFIASLIAFRESDVDCAVFEVGMGGRLDATNILEAPVATAVTRIALDHTQSLGNTLDAIAHEKACIAKARCPMVLGNMDETARETIRRVAITRGAAPVWNAEQTPWGSLTFCTSLAGQHQQDNARVAAAVCCCAASKLDRLTLAHVQDAVASVSWPGRLESIYRNGTEFLLDGAHNPDAVEALAKHLEDRRIDPTKTVLVFGVMQDKAWPSMLDRLDPVASQRIYVAPKGRAPALTSELAERLPGIQASSVKDALAQAADNTTQGGVVVVCGSLFLVAEARAVLLGQEMDTVVAM